MKCSIFTLCLDIFTQGLWFQHFSSELPPKQCAMKHAETGGNITSIVQCIDPQCAPCASCLEVRSYIMRPSQRCTPAQQRSGMQGHTPILTTDHPALCSKAAGSILYSKANVLKRTVSVAHPALPQGCLLECLSHTGCDHPCTPSQTSPCQKAARKISAD